MKPKLNHLVNSLTAPPIPEVQSWASQYDLSHGELIDLSQAVPGYPPPDILLDQLAKTATSADLMGYGRIEGEPTFRAAYADHVSGFYGTDIGAEEVHITSGCNQAFIATAIALAGAGDTILMTNPRYFNHETTLSMLGIHTAFIDCEPNTGFLPNIEELKSALDGVTAFALVSPNNPTGTIYPAELLQQIHEACCQAGVWLIVDETYRDFMPEQARHQLFANKEWSQNFVQLYSFSKSFCIPGHRLGAIVAGVEVIEAVSKVMDNMQICAPRAAQQAVAATLEPLADWRRDNQMEIERRADALVEAFSKPDGWMISSMGAYFAYVQHPFDGQSSVEVAQKLAREVGISCIPGSFFGENQDRYLRFAFANADAKTIQNIPGRLAKLVI